MEYSRQTYVRFLYPGIMLSEDSVHKVENRDVSKIRVPEDAFAFQFFDVLSTTVTVNSKNIALTSEEIDVSPRHYYGGKVYTIAELKRELPNEHTLINNVQNNHYKKVIKCRTGNWQPFEKTDIFVEIT